MAQSALITRRGAVVDLGKAGAARRYAAAGIIFNDRQYGGDVSTQLHQAFVLGARGPRNAECEKARVTRGTLNNVAVALLIWINEARALCRLHCATPHFDRLVEDSRNQADRMQSQVLADGGVGEAAALQQNRCPESAT